MLDNAFYFNYINVKFKAKTNKIFLLSVEMFLIFGSAINEIVLEI